MKRILFIVIIFGLQCNLFCQGISNIWIAGYAAKAGPPGGQSVFNFYNGNIQITYDSLPMDFRHTHANISDSAGNLLFYTNGYYIADATNDTMDNGSGINPGAYANFVPDGFLIPQGVLALPKPNHPNIYCLFHNSADAYPIIPGSSVSYYFYMTEIDMSLNGGLGAVTSKNYKLHTDSMNAGKIAGCKHGNGRDWWIMIHRVNSNQFIKFLLTPYGVSGPYFQNIGSYRIDDAGQAKFAPDGNKYAYYSYRGNSDLDVFDFDRCTGMLSNWRNDTIKQVIGNTGMEFSPNSNIVYVSNITEVYQYDLTASTLLAGRTMVAAYDGFKDPVWNTGTYLCLSQLAPDGKIYMSTGNGTTFMHAIDQPDVVGIGCNVLQHSVVLPSLYFNTLPNHPNYSLGDNGLCNNLSYESLESWKVKKVTVFGNPTHDKFTLWFPPDKDVGVLEIYDVNGACIRTERVSQWSQYKTVDISTLSAGVYFCKMIWPDGEGSCRVVRLE